MRQCICQICVCGRHRCKHKLRRVPFAKEDDGTLPITECKDRFRFHGHQPRQQPFKPPSEARWRGDEPTVKISTTRNDYVAFPIKKRQLMRPKVLKEPKGKMEGSTTYLHDYGPKKGLPRSLAKTSQPARDGVMPGTLPGKIEGSTTYGRSYTPKHAQKREKALAKECTLTVFGQPFTGETETAMCYQKPPYLKREKILPAKGQLKPEGDFEGITTHKSDYGPKYQIPVKPIKKEAKWQPGKEKFEGITTHAHDYKCPDKPEKPPKCVPRQATQRFEGDFIGKSHYKDDYQAHEITPRETPKWHPLFRPYEKSDIPMDGLTTYQTDYEPPGEDIVPFRSRPLKGNLTIPSEPMEKITTAMRDYREIKCPIPTKSFKPEMTYQKPHDKFASQTITNEDYTPKTAEKQRTSKLPDNLKVGDGPMEDLTTTMNDFQWLAIECPAAYIKLFGKDALPQYTFDKTEGGHDYFKKKKTKKERK